MRNGPPNPPVRPIDNGALVWVVGINSDKKITSLVSHSPSEICDKQ